MLVVRQNHRRRNRHAHLVRQRIVEELVVRRPPERIVDDNRSVQHRVLQIGAVERNVLRNTVDDDVVFLRLIHADAADLHELGGNALDLHRVDLLDQCRRKRILHAKKNSDFLVCHSPASSSKPCYWSDDPTDQPTSRPDGEAQRPSLKILSRHPLPQWPIMLAVIAVDVQPMRNPLAVQNPRHLHIRVQAHIPIRRSQHNLHLPVPAQEPLIARVRQVIRRIIEVDMSSS